MNKSQFTVIIIVLLAIFVICDYFPSYRLVPCNCEPANFLTANSSSNIISLYRFLGTRNKCENWSEETIKSVKKFIFFFGFDRSGSTVTGRIIDAHPHALIANELGIFGDLSDFNYTGKHRISQFVLKDFRSKLVRQTDLSRVQGPFGLHTGDLTDKRI